MSPDRLDVTFAALADPTRRAILARLARGDASVLELAEPFSMSQPAISKHIKVLEGAGLVVQEPGNRLGPRRLELGPFAKAAEWLDVYSRIWAARLAHFGRAKKGAGKRPRARRSRA